MRLVARSQAQFFAISFLSYILDMKVLEKRDFFTHRG